MNWWRIVLAMSMLAYVGCDEVEDAVEDAEVELSEEADAATGEDQSTWDAIEWLTSRGPDCKGAVQVFTLGATLDGTEGVYYSYDSYPWTDSGFCHFFIWNGSNYKGGKFDWIRNGGQTYKELKHLSSGYNGHTVPNSGDQVATAWTTQGGDERSNLIEMIWP